METFLARAGSLVFFLSQRFAWPPRCLSLSAWARGGTRRFDLLFIFYFTLHCTHPSFVPSGFMVNCSLILLSSRSLRRIFSRSVCKRGGHHLMARGFPFFLPSFFFAWEMGNGRKRRTLYIKIITSTRWTFNLMSLTSILCKVSCSHYH
jgi:hypothetical protein